MGDDPVLARPLGVRDAAIGAALLYSGGLLPLLLRTAADVSDAVKLRHRSPKTAAAALAFGIWSAATATALRRLEGYGEA